MGVYEDAMAIARQESNVGLGKDTNRELQIMQFLENMVATNKDKKLVKDQNIMSGLMGNLGTANSDVHFQNLDSLIQNTTVQPENELVFETFKNMFTDKREAYNLGKQVYNDIAPTIGSSMEEDKYYLTEEKLMNFDFGYDKNGNRVRPEIGDNQIDYLKKELEKVSSDIIKLENGKSFKYGKVDNVQLIDKLKKYQGTLTKTMQARFGGLTSQEANVILWQDNYDEVRNTKLRNINSSINTAKRNEVKWQSQRNNLMKSLKGGTDAEWMLMLADLDPELKEMAPSDLTRTETGQAIVTDDIAKLQNQLGALIENEQLNQINLIKERKAWQVYDETDTREAGSFGDEADVGPEGWTPYQEQRFQEGYGIDVDTGLLVSNEFAPGQAVGGGEVVEDDSGDDTLGAREQEIKQRLNEIESTIGANTEQAVIEPLMEEGMSLREELKNINDNKTDVTNNNNKEQFVVPESDDPKEEMSSGMDPYIDIAADIVKDTAPWIALAKADKIAIQSYNLTKNLTKSAQHIYDVSKMSNSDIEKFLKSENVQGILKRIEKLKKQRDKFQPGQAASRAKIQQDIDNLVNDASKRLSRNFNTPQTTMKRLLQNPARWNWLGYKQGLVSKLGSGVMGIGGSIIMGEVISSAIESKTNYEVGQTASMILPEGLDKTSEILETVGLGYVSKKLLDRTWIPKVVTMLTDDKAKKYLKDKLIKKYGKKYGTRYMKRLIASGVAGKKYGRYGMVAATAYTLGDIGMELYNEIMAYNPEDPIIARGPEMKKNKELREKARDNRPLNHIAFENLFDEHHEQFLSSIKEKEYDLDTDIDYNPSLKEKSPMQNWENNMIMPSKIIDPVMMRGPEFKLKKEESERIRSLAQFKDKYNLSQKAISLLSKLKSRKINWAQKKKIQKELDKELKKLGLLK
tara:strand:- start:10004 stop:12748 length:2745 start_codon:yes stop_codon:yes gene_type:complete